MPSDKNNSPHWVSNTRPFGLFRKDLSTTLSRGPAQTRSIYDESQKLYELPDSLCRLKKRADLKKLFRMFYQAVKFMTSLCKTFYLHCVVTVEITGKKYEEIDAIRG
jgi:hypothetical protein